MPSVNDVSLLGLGEPFMNPAILSMAGETKSRGITVRTATNGTLLGRYEPRRILEAFDEIIFSIDAADPETFSRMREGAVWDVVFKNMASLAETKNRLGIATQITTNTVLSIQNRDEVAGLFEIGKALGIAKMRFVMAGDLASRTDALMKQHREHIWTTRIQAADVERAIGEQVKSLSAAAGIPASFAGNAPYAPGCRWPLRGTFVSHDGRVTPCCMRMDPDEYGFGNALEQPISEIWASPAYARFREASAAGAAGGGIPDVCRGCPA